MKIEAGDAFDQFGEYDWVKFLPCVICKAPAKYRFELRKEKLWIIITLEKEV